MSMHLSMKAGLPRFKFCPQHLYFGQINLSSLRFPFLYIGSDNLTYGIEFIEHLKKYLLSISMCQTLTVGRRKDDRQSLVLKVLIFSGGRVTG